MVLILACGCGGGGGGDDPDAAEAQPDAGPPPPGCIQNDVRDDHTVTVSGSVRDWVTGNPVAGATVEVNTAWDVDGNFPPLLGCPPIVTLTTDSNGQFGPAMIQAGSTTEPPIMMYMVSGAGLARTASDARLGNCMGVDCGNQGHPMRVPSETLVQGWRTELELGGMPLAATRGLVLFDFRELAGPAAGVIPQDGSLVDLVAGTEVRFLEDDRMTLAPATATATTPAGVALIGVDAVDNESQVAGRRGGDTWLPTGVLVTDGWVFLEDRLVSP